MNQTLRLTTTVVILCLFFSQSVRAQNLCPNPGFEQLSGCPSGAGEITISNAWQHAGNPADLFNTCHVNGTPAGCNDVDVPVNFAGAAASHTGNSYAGIYTRMQNANARTYIQVSIPTLTAGGLYRVSAWFRWAAYSKYATNNQGFAFSTGPLAQPGTGNIPIVPQLEMSNAIADSSGWTLFEAFYTATGIENNFAIGNFRNDANTLAFNFNNPASPCSSLTGAAYYYVDDVTIQLVNEQLSVTGDTLICLGENTVLTGISNTTGWWSLLSTPNDTLASVNGELTVYPLSTTSYVWHGLVKTYVVTVSVAPPPVVNLGSDTTLCEGKSVTLYAGNPGSSYTWSTGATASLIAVADSGLYSVVVDNGYCTASDTIQISVLPAPVPFLGVPPPICTDQNETVVLDAGPALGYHWSPGGDTTRMVEVGAPGVYVVTATFAGGCTRAAGVEVVEICKETLYVPGAFTPNKDGKNELFFAEGINLLKYEIVIYNRWGQRVFDAATIGSAGGWDGEFNNTPCEQGIYVYRIRYEALKENGRKKTEFVNGSFFLAR